MLLKEIEGVRALPVSFLLGQEKKKKNILFALHTINCGPESEKTGSKNEHFSLSKLTSLVFSHSNGKLTNSWCIKSFSAM